MTPTDQRHLHYQGYRATPPLWRDGVLTEHRQIDLPSGPDKLLPTEKDLPRRLGKRTEAFVFHQLRNTPGIEWIADGLQIQENRRTVGELDALYYDQGTPVHLEVAYKFYLYDTLCEAADPLARWIGPNRKDNLSLKLRKLRERQFPLLHHSASQPYLTAYGLAADQCAQRVCCKGQLYLPYDDREVGIGPLNRACVAGFHLPFRELERLAGFRFYVPRKLDWLIVPHDGVRWLDHADAKLRINDDIREGRSPLVWWRSGEESVGRCFLTAW